MLEQLSREDVDVVTAEENAGFFHQAGCPHEQITVSGVHLHKNVNVASLVRGTAGDRPEELGVRCCVICQECMELAAACVEELAEGERLRRYDGLRHTPRIPRKRGWAPRSHTFRHGAYSA